MPSKAGVVQFCPLYGRPKENLAALAELITFGAKQSARLLVLPEMAWTGYLWAGAETLFPFSEAAGDGPGQAEMARLAQQFDLWLVFGYAERQGDLLYNSQGLVSPRGEFQPVYRKTHLFEADTWWAQPGNTGYRVWPTDWGRVGSGICMDLNFPDLIDFHYQAGTDILAFSTNWLDQGMDIVPYWLDCLVESKHQNPFPGLALFANRGGQEFGVGFRGQSTIFTTGQIRVTVPHRENTVLLWDLPE